MSTDDKHEDGALEPEAPSVRQPWEPPTEEEAQAAVKESLAPHLTAEESEEEENKPDGAAKPEGGEEKQEKQKEKENAEDESEKEESEESKEEGEGESSLPVRQEAAEAKPTRLDKRIAEKYIQNLALSGLPVPEIESVLSELTSGQFSQEQKVKMLRLHLRQNKELRGVDVRKQEDQDRENSEIIRESEREQIREEIRQEENQKAERADFIKFLEEHPELDEEQDGYKPELAIAVQTLFEGGMNIRDAFKVVTHQFEAVKAEHAKTEERTKQKALSGAMSASTKVQKGSNNDEYTWAEFNQLMIDDPAEWERLIRSGYQPKS